ncbi:MAG: response regulator [Bacteroidota bacterium]
MVAVEDWEPLAAEEEPEEIASFAALPATGQEATRTATRPTVLVVEDNPEMRDYLRLILEEKYNVVTAENGQAAWEVLQSVSLQSISPQSAANPDNAELKTDKLKTDKLKTDELKTDELKTDELKTVDLIISDIMMPVMDGYQLLEKLKSDDRWRHLPIIMLTARADLRDKLKALRIGVDDYLIKPFEEDELLVRIENLLQNSRNRVVAKADDEGEKTTAPALSQADADWLAEVEQLARNGSKQKLLSVNWLSEKANLSERQFRRRLQNLTGLTPNEYLTELRLQEARSLLEIGKYATIAEVAYAVGYNDAAAFSRSFRNCFGKSPSDYLPG